MTSCVNIDCTDRSCVRLDSSVEQLSEHKSRVIGFKSHVRLTLCLEYILYMIIYDIYIYSKYISYSAPPYATLLHPQQEVPRFHNSARNLVQHNTQIFPDCFKDKPCFLTNIPLNYFNLFNVPTILALTDSPALPLFCQAPHKSEIVKAPSPLPILFSHLSLYIVDFCKAL